MLYYNKHKFNILSWLRVINYVGEHDERYYICHLNNRTPDHFDLFFNSTIKNNLVEGGWFSYFYKTKQYYKYNEYFSPKLFNALFKIINNSIDLSLI
jgi:hypothetical protein